MNKEEILEDVKRHLDYVNATNQKSIRDTEMEVMYQEIDRLNNNIKRANELLELLHYNFSDYDDIHERINDIQKALQGSDKE